MPMDIALHPLGNPVQGNHPPAPPLPTLDDQTGLAVDTDSDVFAVPKAGAVLALVSTAKVRVDVQRQGVALDAATSGIVLLVDQPRLFSLPEGNWLVRSTAYV